MATYVAVEAWHNAQPGSRFFREVHGDSAQDAAKQAWDSVDFVGLPAGEPSLSPHQEAVICSNERGETLGYLVRTST